MFKLTDATKTTIRGKLQLWIGYLMIGLLVSTAALAVYNYTQRLRQDVVITKLDADLGKAQAQVDEVVEVNRKQSEAIETIRGLNGVNDTMLKGLALDMESLRVQDRSVRSRLASLERNNEAIREYLNTAVPAPVGCVLDQTCSEGDGDPSSATERGVAGEVRTASTRPEPHQR